MHNIVIFLYLYLQMIFFQKEIEVFEKKNT